MLAFVSKPLDKSGQILGKPLITDDSSWVFSLPACSQGGIGAPFVTVVPVRDEVPDVSRFRQKELLGSGGFADVYRQGLMGISCDLTCFLAKNVKKQLLFRGIVHPHQTLATCRPALFALCMIDPAAERERESSHPCTDRNIVHTVPLSRVS